MADFLRRKRTPRKRNVGNPSQDKKPGKLLQTLDVCAKLIAAGAIVAAAIVGAKFESSVSTLSLRNQREQADSELRASMFQNLIDPIIGSAKDKEPDADRERLLAELLTLNFHDHFELKPLLKDVDERLALLQDKSTEGKYSRGRESLRSAARRVIDRQINTLFAVADEIKKVSGNPKQGVKVVNFYFKEEEPDSKENCKVSEPNTNNEEHCVEMGMCRENPVIFSNSEVKGGLPSYITSEDHVFRLEVSVQEVDWGKGIVTLGGMIQKREEGSNEEYKYYRDLQLDISPFDFPLTDNFRIDLKHRFSVTQYELDDCGGTSQLKFVWFPEGYITERERPLEARLTEQPGLAESIRKIFE